MRQEPPPKVEQRPDTGYKTCQGGTGTPLDTPADLVCEVFGQLAAVPPGLPATTVAEAALEFPRPVM